MKHIALLLTILGVLFSSSLQASEYPNIEKVYAGIASLGFETEEGNRYCYGFYVDQSHVLTHVRCLIGAHSGAVLKDSDFRQRIEGFVQPIEGVVSHIDYTDIVVLKKYLTRFMPNTFRQPEFSGIKVIPLRISDSPVARDEQLFTLKPRTKPITNEDIIDTRSGEKTEPGLNDTHYDLILGETITDEFTDYVYDDVVAVSTFESAVNNGLPMVNLLGEVLGIVTYSRTAKAQSFPFISLLKYYKETIEEDIRSGRVTPMKEWVDEWLKTPEGLWHQARILLDNNGKDGKIRNLFLEALGEEKVRFLEVDEPVEHHRIWAHLGRFNKLDKSYDDAVIAYSNAARFLSNDPRFMFDFATVHLNRTSTRLTTVDYYWDSADKIFSHLFTITPRNSVDYDTVIRGHFLLGKKYKRENERSARYKKELELLDKLAPHLARELREYKPSSEAGSWFPWCF